MIETLDGWLASCEPNAILRTLEHRLEPRKLRLFACACCDRIRHLYGRPAVQIALQTARKAANDEATREELRIGWLAIRKALGTAPLGTHWEDALMAALHATSEILPMGEGWPVVYGSLVSEAVAKAADREWRSQNPQTARRTPNNARLFKGSPEERAAHARILRDLFPWKPLPEIAGDWLNWQQEQVAKIAHTLYHEQAFDDLWVLADALEDAGCPYQDMIDHCRTEKGKDGCTHVQGCWVLDAILRGTVE